LPSTNNSRKDLLRYAGLGSQLLVAIGMAVFIGYKLDHWLKLFPVLTSVLPLLVLSAIFYKLVRDTSGKRSKQDDETK
jgi:hypothetical protein